MIEHFNDLVSCNKALLDPAEGVIRENNLHGLAHHPWSQILNASRSPSILLARLVMNSWPT